MVRRTGQDVAWTADRDVWWHDIVGRQPDTHGAEAFDSEHPLFILYTSRHDREAEGHPAHHRRVPDPGRVHPRSVFDLKPETDVYWCTADIGWVTGHSYIVYGPLANGATQVMYEGTPDTPHQGRFWEIVEKYRVSILYTAPTAIRTFMKWGDDIPAQLRPVVAAAARHRSGEPINPEAWMWYRRAHRRRTAARSSTPGGRPRPARS